MKNQYYIIINCTTNTYYMYIKIIQFKIIITNKYALKNEHFNFISALTTITHY